MMKKWILITLGVVVVIAIIGGLYFWNSMNQPLYEPGDLSTEGYLRSPLEPPDQADEGDFWQVEPDIQLYHFSAGEGRNVLVLHGGPGQPSHEPWPGLESLNGEYKFHYYDQRGAGKSTRPVDAFETQNYYENTTQLDQTLGLGAQIADIERIRRILGEEKIIIIGHSFGAFQAALYAAEFPERVESLILVTPAPLLKMPMDYPGLFENIEARLPKDMLADYQRWQEEYLDFGDIFSQTEDELVALNEEIADYFLAVGGISQQQLPEGVRPGGWMVTATYLSMGRAHDYRSAMDVVASPVLVIHAGDDIVQAEEASRSYLEVFPQAQFVVIEEAGHFVFFDQPKEFGKVIGGFLP